MAESICRCGICKPGIAGLAQGREIEGQIVYLGRPLYIYDELRNCF